MHRISAGSPHYFDLSTKHTAAIKMIPQDWIILAVVLILVAIWWRLHRVSHLLMLLLPLAFVLSGATVGAGPGIPRYRENITVLHTEGGWGTGYFLGHSIQTAAHIISGRITLDGGIHAPVTCVDRRTDSAVLEGSGLGLLSGSVPALGEPVTVAGFLRSGYAEIDARVTYQFPFVNVGDGPQAYTIGPVIVLRWDGKSAAGMSGGPVIYRGNAIATVSAWNYGLIVAVPLDQAVCRAH